MPYESFEKPKYLKLINAFDVPEKYIFEESNFPTEFVLEGDRLKPNADARFTPFLPRAFKGLTEQDEKNDYQNVTHVKVTLRPDGKYEIPAM
jgi:hypothetical protein